MERELPDYIKRLQAVLAAEPAKQAKYRAHIDRQFFELKLHLYIAFEMRRRRTARLERRIAALEDAQQTDARKVRVASLLFWELN